MLLKSPNSVAICAAIAFLVSMPSQASEERAYQLAMSNLGHETIECAAYYWMVSELLKSRVDSADLIASNMKVSKILYERATIIADGIGQKRETVAARFEMSATSMRDAIGGNASNSSILLNRYGRPCKVTSDNVEARFEYWMGQALQEESRRPRQ
jgi:hypothetical protein